MEKRLHSLTLIYGHAFSNQMEFIDFCKLIFSAILSTNAVLDTHYSLMSHELLA